MSEDRSYMSVTGSGFRLGLNISVGMEDQRYLHDAAVYVVEEVHPTAVKSAGRGDNVSETGLALLRTSETELVSRYQVKSSSRTGGEKRQPVSCLSPPSSFLATPSMSRMNAESLLCSTHGSSSNVCARELLRVECSTTAR